MAKYKKHIVIQRNIGDKNIGLNYLIYEIYKDFISELINLNNFNNNEYKKSKNN